MLKCGCVFDRSEIANFYSLVGEKIQFDNISMFFALYENDEMKGLVKMFPENGRCRVQNAIKTKELTRDMEEFLIKSAINFALTFDTKEIIMDRYYEAFLLPMNFRLEEDELVGELAKIDFPHKCCHE